MSEISNKTLVGLLVVAIVISLAGTFISLSKLGQLGITGLQSQNVTQQTGTTSVTLYGTYALTIWNSSVQWGSGQINGSYTAGYDYCNLTTNGVTTGTGNDFSGSGLGAGGKTAPCDGFATATPWSMVLENTGTGTFANVTLTADDGESSGGASFQSVFGSNAKFQFRTAEEGDSCTGSTALAYGAVPTTATDVCTTFVPALANDAFIVQLRMDIPEDATTGTFDSVLTFDGNI